MHSFFVLFHLIKVVGLVILLEEEGGQRVYVGTRYPAWNVICGFCILHAHAL